jgi:hypothetical protein
VSDSKITVSCYLHKKHCYFIVMEQPIFLLEAFVLLFQIEVVLLILAQAKHLALQLIDDNLLLIDLDVKWTIILQ